MDRSSYLEPTLLAIASNSIASTLKTQNQKLAQSCNNLGMFINDTDIKSSTFDQLKMQMNDYLMLNSSMIFANLSDIADCETLKSRMYVVSNILDGDQILTQKEVAGRGRVSAEINAEIYRNRKSTALTPVMILYYEGQAQRYDNLAILSQQLYEAWLAKEDEYDDLETETADLFSGTEGLRETITEGIKEVSGSFSEGSYTPNPNAKWRETIKVELGEAVANIIAHRIKMGNPDISDADIEKIVQEILNNPIKDGQSNEDYVLGIFNKLSDVLGISLDTLEELLKHVDDLAELGKLANILNGLSGYAKGIPVASALLDLVTQLLNGENIIDAAVKTGAHMVIGGAGAGIGAAIGAEIAGPVGGVAGGVIGVALVAIFGEDAVDDWIDATTMHAGDGVHGVDAWKPYDIEIDKFA